jgi:hypothetical protein
MAGSAADAISKAVERSKQMLFPIKGDKWFALGLTVFLAQCGEQSGGTTFNMPGSFPSTPRPPSTSGGPSPFPSELAKIIDEAVSTIQADLALYIGLAVLFVVVSLGIWLVVVWVTSRAKLMFIESVIWDRVDVSSQWARAGELGLSLFKFRVAFSLCSSALFLLALGGALLVGIPDFRSGNFLGSRALTAYGVFGVGFFVFGLPASLVAAALDDFVAPLMVLRNAPVTEAWRQFRSEVLSGHVGGLILFYLLRIALGLGIVMIVTMATCLTCCLASLPYLGTVITLPIWVFARAYPLYFLEELGIAVFPAPEPSWVQYDQWRFPR